MRFDKVGLAGAFLIQIERAEDERGFFARSYCEREFAAQGLNPRVVQCNISHNTRRATLRGMHFQAAPRAEAKLVRCTAGAIHDVIVDLRAYSPTCMGQYGVRLDADNRAMLFVPEGFAHGFITLEDDTEVLYQMSEFYSPEHARGFRWDDPAFEIAWPLKPAVVSARDSSYPDFDPKALLFGRGT